MVLVLLSPLVNDFGDLLDLVRLVVLVGGDQLLRDVVQLVDVRLVLVDLRVEGLKRRR